MLSPADKTGFSADFFVTFEHPIAPVRVQFLCLRRPQGGLLARAIDKGQLWHITTGQNVATTRLAPRRGKGATEGAMAPGGRNSAISGVPLQQVE